MRNPLSYPFAAVTVSPAATGFEKRGYRWNLYVIDGNPLPIEAGGGFADIGGGVDIRAKPHNRETPRLELWPNPAKWGNASENCLAGGVEKIPCWE